MYWFGSRSRKSKDNGDNGKIDCNAKINGGCGNNSKGGRMESKQW